MMNKRIILCSILVFSALGCSPSPITPKTSGTPPSPSPSLLFDAHGFNSAGIHTNGTSYDDQGYDVHGFSKPRIRPYWRFHRNGTLFNDEGITYNGFRFDEESYSYLHNETHEIADPEGYTWKGYSWDSVNNQTRLNRRGFPDHYARTDRLAGRLDQFFYGEASGESGRPLRDPQGLDFLGFNEQGIHYITETEYNEEGLNARGQTREGFVCITEYGLTQHIFPILQASRIQILDAEGYNVWGFNREGNHRNGTRYSEYGFDSRFFNREGVHAFTGTRWDEAGFRLDGVHRNETQYDQDGFNRDGFNREGFNRDGFNRDGFNRDGFGRDGFNRDGFGRDGFGRDGFDRQGFGRDGFNRAGYSRLGFLRTGRHRITGGNLNQYGFAINGTYQGVPGVFYDTDPTRAWNCRGFRRDNLYASTPPAQYDPSGFDYQGIHHLTRTVLDPHGYNCWGFHHQTGQPRPAARP